MLRFIDIDRQITPHSEQSPRMFAIYNTTNDRFVDLLGTQVWESYAEFRDQANDAISEQGDLPNDLLKRVYHLCPEWAKGGVEC